MGVKFWDPAVAIDDRGRHDPLRARAARSRSTARRYDDAGRARARGQRHRRPARPRHVRPDREPHHRGQVARHLRGARHGPALDRLRAPAQRDPQRGHHRQLPRRGPPARPAALRGPLARPAGADAARVDPALDRLAGHRRGDAAAAPRRGLHRSCAPTGRPSPTTPTSSRWSAPRTPRSARPTGSASSPCATSTSPTRAPSSSCTPPSRSTRARCSSSTAPCSASSSPVAPTGSPATRRPRATTSWTTRPLGPTAGDGVRDRLMS